MGGWGGGQREREARADAHHALDGNVTPHRSRQIATDGEAEPDAASPSPFTSDELNERLEDRLEPRRRNAWSHVGDRHQHPLAIETPGHADRARPLLRVLHRIRHEIHEDLANPALVSPGGYVG